MLIERLSQEPAPSLALDGSGCTVLPYRDKFQVIDYYRIIMKPELFSLFTHFYSWLYIWESASVVLPLDLCTLELRRAAHSTNLYALSDKSAWRVKGQRDRQWGLPDHSLSLRPANSAEWQTAAGYRPRLSAARCGLGRAWRNPPGARTRTGPPRSAAGEGSDLRAQESFQSKQIIISEIYTIYKAFCFFFPSFLHLPNIQ